MALPLRGYPGNATRVLSTPTGVGGRAGTSPRLKQPWALRRNRFAVGFDLL
jgi:hypothetical protein